MKIAVVGMGYVGLANAVMLSRYHQVSIAEIDAQKVHNLNQGISPLKDPEITSYLNQNQLRLSATNDHLSAYQDAAYILICIPTNFIESQQCFDTLGIEAVLRQISETNFSGVVIIRSTVPIGFTEEVQKKFSDLVIAFYPEFLREGQALHDSLSPSRIVCGSSNVPAQEFISILKNCAIKKNIKTLVTSSSEAEAIKLFSNAYLAMRISFFNELDTFALSESLETEKIIDGICMDDRIGGHYNNPSFGYGGYCLPKDMKQLYSHLRKLPLPLLKATIFSNKKRKQYLLNKILDRSQGAIGIYGLAMKSDSDNYRESSILWIIQQLKKREKDLLIFEPLINSVQYQGIPVINDLDAFYEQSDLIIANRTDKDLEAKDAMQNKIFSRDIFHRN